MLKLHLSKQRFGVYVLFASLCSLVGCASQIREQVTVSEMLQYRVVCSQKEAQLLYLHSLMPKRAEEQYARINLKLFGPLNPDVEGQRRLASGRVAYFVQDKIDEVMRCPD